MASATPLSPTALTTLQTAKQYFGISDPSIDTRLTNYINWISDALQQYCNHKFTYQNLTEQYNSEGRQMLVLKNWPIANIAQILLGVADDGTGGFIITDWQIDNADGGVLYRDAGWTDTRLSDGELVYEGNRFTPYGGITAGDSINAYHPSPFAFRKSILVQYAAGYILPQYQQTATLATSTAVTALSQAVTDNLLGLYVYGNGIPLNTTVAAIVSETAITLSQAASISATGVTLTFGPAGPTFSQPGTLNSSTTVTGIQTTYGLVGAYVTGSGIPANTTVGSVVNSTTITLSNAATTSGTSTLTFTIAGVTNAPLMPNALQGACCAEVDRVYGVNLARGLKNQSTGADYRVTFYNDSDIDPQVLRLINSGFRDHCAG